MDNKTFSSLELAQDIALAANSLKAVDVKILDLRKVTSFTDYFVIASGTSDRHTESIADAVEFELKKKGHRPLGVEGHDHAQWVIVDYGDVVAHIFYQPMREIYDIERLWADAKVVKIKVDKPKAKEKGKGKKEKVTVRSKAKTRVVSKIKRGAKKK